MSADAIEAMSPYELEAQAFELEADALRLRARASRLRIALERTPAVSPSAEPTSMTRSEYAKHSRLSTASISRLIAEGLPVSYVGDRARIDPIAADAWLATRGRKPTKDKSSGSKRDAANDVDVSGALARGGFRSNVRGTAA